MKIEKIKIDSISDDKKFLDVALLVDQPYFIKLCAKARDIFQTDLQTKLPVPYSQYLDLVRVSSNKEKVQTKLDTLIQKSLSWLHLSVVYAGVIEASVISGEVKSTDFNSVVLSSESLLNLTKIDLKYSQILALSPNARKEDVLNAFSRYKAGFERKSLKVDDKFGETYSGYTYLQTPSISSRMKSETRKFRLWYWLDKDNRANFPNGRLPRGKQKNFILSIAKLPIRYRSNDETEIKNGIKFYKHLLDISKTR